MRLVNRAIQTNPDLFHNAWTASFFNDFWGTPLTHPGSHKSYRPLCVLSYRFNYLLGGFNPWGYHAFNVLLHVITTALFAYLCLRLFKGRKIPSYIASLTFAVHPIHTEAVAGLVGRAELGAAMFFLLSLLAYQKHALTANGHTWQFVSLGLATCAMLSKETGVTVIGVCAVAHVCAWNSGTHRTKEKMVSRN
ncbi:unnamed protein product [Cyprideis torosa]|uniref:Glycosyltransferase RgtA/B/C/D-like domain-containing protein n=1 Tax=Cyprideis torosa TaxID=163714 RepID=A0A7R8W2Z4_9CRUS|nr:unnamed protein product [Cyprideis torosa]CAG0879155.1 unnamed protein product [Cyprideis torosa]